MDANTGGPAFPQTIDDTGTLKSLTAGMSLRDYFAAAALPELIRSALDLDHVKWDAAAAHAYIIADAMLAERAN
jgi:hypothetical protein